MGGYVAAVLYAWLPGQAMGEALADVLLGHAEPTWPAASDHPAREADCPVLQARPTDGVSSYDKGLLIGYRGYDPAGTSPHFPFGHGLGYTTWAYESLRAGAGSLAPGDDLQLLVTVRNSSGRGRDARSSRRTWPGRRATAPGRFARWPRSGSPRAPGNRPRWRCACRQGVRPLGTGTASWTWPREVFTLEVGRSSRDLRLSAQVAPG